MSNKFLSLVLVYFVLIGCNPSQKEKKESKDFSSLTEDEKRLPENALASMTVANGLEVELFASEPMITNPTNISVDDKGRVWVCEAYNYDVAPEQADKKGDRIIVLEDTNQDGKADKRTVFYQGTDITTPLGIMVLGNKVYVTRSPNLYIFTDTNGDLVADQKDSLFTNMGKKGDHSAHAMFPGPDGKLYFSTGNYAGDIHDSRGNQIIDKAGFAVTQKGKPYLGGMVLRSDADGKNFEVLGHNFRNNYEPCIDSYGNVWQSDNDDDGNESCRINFVMPYGNYGYLDEMSKASWGTNRVNIEEKIPERHWHQNDPGVVPNVLITGAGSPAGITIYEGDLLPEDYRGYPIHTEPYYNSVRAYVTKKDGAGYTATIKEILKSDDQWFRPIDVSTAPDGSLFVADWYDPILGGGAAGDAVRGRIFRIAPKASTYNVPEQNITSVEGAIQALKNPNLETRYLGLQHLLSAGEKAIPALQELWKSENPVLRARALWLLAKLDQTDTFLKEALADKNDEIRIAAVRAVLQNKDNVVPLLQYVVTDKDAGVRREVATSLRYANTPEAAKLWVELAKQYDPKDRWYLEALGIGSDLSADLFFAAWQNAVKVDLKDKAHQDIIWRSRSAKALPLLATLIKEEKDSKSTHRYFRAFDFHTDKSKATVLASLVSLDRKDNKEMSALALRQMDGSQVKMTSPLRTALEGALQETQGTVAYVNLVEKFALKDKKIELLQLAAKPEGSEVGAVAVDLLLKFKEIKLLQQGLQREDSEAIALMQSLKGKGNSEVVSLIKDVVEDTTRSLSVRQSAVQVLGSSWPGEEQLLSLVKKPGFENELKPAAAGVLFNVYRSSIQREAALHLPKPTTKGSNLPSVKQLIASSGNSKNGKVLFTKYCVVCHKVKEEGVKFGPELTQIGDKLSREGLYRAIIFPDEGISFGYESTLVTLQDGSQSMGIIASETDAGLELNQPGGSSVKYTKDKVKGKERSDKSLMPALATAMTEQELVDLVEYLSTLKK